MNRRSVSILLARRSAGQSMAEFGVTATVFLLLLFGIMQMATVVNAYSNVSTAAREAARYAIVHSPSSASSPCSSSGCTASQLQTVCSAIQQQAVNYAPFLSLGGGGCSVGDINVSFTNPPPASPSTDYAVIVISHTYPLNIPFMSSINLQLSSSSRMLVSQ